VEIVPEKLYNFFFQIVKTMMIDSELKKNCDFKATEHAIMMYTEGRIVKQKPKI